jgi:hypothetical protein
MPVRTLPTRPAVGGDTVDQVVEFYYRYLARNRDLAVHFGQFKKRLKADPQAATAEAIVYSHLRAERLHPELFEHPASGGPDSRCHPTAPFLVEVTSLDSAVVAKRSGLPATISGPGGGAFGLITDRLLSEAKNKAPQLGRHPPSRSSGHRLRPRLFGHSSRPSGRRVFDDLGAAVQRAP